MDTEITVETVSVPKLRSHTAAALSFQHRSDVACVSACRRAPACVVMWARYSRFRSSHLQMVFVSGVCCAAARHSSGGQTNVIAVQRFAQGGGQLGVEYPWLPKGGARKGFLEEVMSMLRSGGAGLAGRSVGGGKGGICLPEGQSDSQRPRGRWDLGHLSSCKISNHFVFLTKT